MFKQGVELLFLKSLSLQKHSTDTLVDSGFYRAGEAVDNVSEFYRPASDYVTYQVSYNSSYDIGSSSLPSSSCSRSSP